MTRTTSAKPHALPLLRIRLRAAALLHASLISSLLPHALPAQAPQDVAQSSLSVVNAVPGEKNVFVSFDGQSIWAPGFTPGQSTAAVLFPSGNKLVKLECEGFATSEAKLDLVPGANCAMIFYPGELVESGADKGKRKIGLFSPPPRLRETKDGASKSWKIVLVGSAKPLEVEANGKKVLLTPRKVSELPASSSMRISQGGKNILSASPPDNGEFWVVVFPESSGVAAALLNHSRFDF